MFFQDWIAVSLSKVAHQDCQSALPRHSCSTMFPMLSIDMLPLDFTNSLNSWHSSRLLVRTLKTLSGLMLESFNILKKLLPIMCLNMERITKCQFENKQQFFIKKFVTNTHSNTQFNNSRVPMVINLIFCYSLVVLVKDIVD